MFAGEGEGAVDRRAVDQQVRLGGKVASLDDQLVGNDLIGAEADGEDLRLAVDHQGVGEGALAVGVDDLNLMHPRRQFGQGKVDAARGEALGGELGAVDQQAGALGQGLTADADAPFAAAGTEIEAIGFQGADLGAWGADAQDERRLVAPVAVGQGQAIVPLGQLRHGENQFPLRPGFRAQSLIPEDNQGVVSEGPAADPDQPPGHGGGGADGGDFQGEGRRDRQPQKEQRAEKFHGNSKGA